MKWRYGARSTRTRGAGTSGAGDRVAVGRAVTITSPKCPRTVNFCGRFIIHNPPAELIGGLSRMARHSGRGLFFCVVRPIRHLLCKAAAVGYDFFPNPVAEHPKPRQPADLTPIARKSFPTHSSGPMLSPFVQFFLAGQAIESCG